MKSVFSEEDRRRITAAVHDAEAGTSGEVVVAATEAADRYEEAAWRGAAILAGCVILLDLLYRYAAPFWLPVPPDSGLLAAVAAGLLALVAVPRLPALRRTLAGARLRSARVRAAALAAFRTERVSATRDRTGVLLFISLLERQVVILPDVGIEAKAPEGAWAGIANRVVAGMKARRPADGIVDAVRECGGLLRGAGFAARPDDVDEKDDGLRILTRNPGV